MVPNGNNTATAKIEYHTEHKNIEVYHTDFTFIVHKNHNKTRLPR